jgi:hypothetical protein
LKGKIVKAPTLLGKVKKETPLQGVMLVCEGGNSRLTQTELLQNLSSLFAILLFLWEVAILPVLLTA